MPGTPETIVSFDFGLRRIGVAVGQQVTQSANPLETIVNGVAGPDWNRISQIVRDWRPDRLIVGMPRHADGSASDLDEHVREFMAQLDRFDLPVEAVDERYSSLEAEAVLKARRAEGLGKRISKEMIDSAAAMLIAERWLKNEHQ